MNKVAVSVRQYATRVVVHESGEDSSVAMSPQKALLVCQKLRPQLENLVGHEGCRVLLMRSLVLATPEVSWLRDVHVNPDGTFDVSDELERKVEPESAIEGGSVLLGVLLELLVNFIGIALTFGVARRVWPELQVSETEFSIEGAQ